MMWSALFLRFYLRYEHALQTRSELMRDWAVHGPFGMWAAKLLGVEEVRLYNSEMIFHKGSDSPLPCKPAWHRDTLAAPFQSDARSVTFNVYLDDIGADGPHGDGLIFQRGSHKTLDSPRSTKGIYEPSIAVGDVLAHDPNVYHTTSGRGCWRRRSLQFRYVEGNTQFAFNASRMHPAPWTLAHSPEVAPHGLSDGDALAGPWYPRVYPSPLESEHTPLGGNIWSFGALLRLVDRSAKLMKDTSGHPTRGYLTLDGPVVRPDEWAFVPFPTNDSGIELLMHKRGASYKAAMMPFATPY
eukprot:CAMPEP_0119312406 /NCGR_PEP_ID=MMETSP1333-20130426/26321_1 /TAXON_ID=418940 /ORGANISM="Scyphosphaera apsteinii, Strain RCC1455" /LENGTH=297 /DNA_ID=CAMNT_0007317019 /DNA_START=335 /DNA_END=1228 /DNA_ORIENTATION=+